VTLSFLSLVLIAQRRAASAQDSMPVGFNKSRYESLQAKSPFALATAAVATPAPQASFAANWYVSGVARIGDTNFVTIKSRDLSTQFSLYGDEQFDGVMLASVSWSDTVGKSTVVLRKGTETARLEFNEAQLHAPAPATVAAGPGAAGAGAAVPNPGAMNPRPGGGNLPGVNMAAANNVTAGPSIPGAPRRRVLPIPVPR